MILMNFLFYLLIFILKINAQDETHKELKVDQETEGSIDSDMGLSFYKLVVPENYQHNKYNLIIRVKESEEQEAGAGFSDPDLYVSKTEQKPNNPENAKWYSERFGEDLISIPRLEVMSGEVFYIGVLCQYKCKYTIWAHIEEEFEINVGTLYMAYIVKGDSLSFRFNVPDKDYEELEIVAYSPRAGYFRLKANKGTTPSDQNSLLAIPSWIGGYSILIDKGSPDYCKNCTFYFLLEAPFETEELFFFVKYDDTVTSIRTTEPIVSTLRPFKTHCYTLKVPEYRKNDNLIIQVMVFNGYLTAHLRPWQKPDQNSAETSSHIIHSERVLKIPPSDRKIGSQETGNYFFCLDTNEFTSYIAKAFFEPEIEDVQKFNFIFRGHELDGYLPKNKAIRYRVLDFSITSNITVSMNVKAGDPKLYAKVCESISQCDYNKARVDREVKSNQLKSAEEYSVGYSITIKDSENICHRNLEKSDTLKDEMNNLPCAVIVIVACDGDQDCEYSLRTTRENSQFLLQPRKPHYQILPYDEEDYYRIIVQDPNVSKLVIVLNSITGDADMRVEYRDQFNDSISERKKLIAVSENEPYLPDVITVDKKTLDKDSLIGFYNITVYASSFASYSIYYYTENDKVPDASPINAVEIHTGHLIKDFYPSDEVYKVYAYNPRLSDAGKDIKITVTPERSQYSINVFLDLSQMKYNDAAAMNKIENALWSTFSNEELTIPKTDPNYKKDAIYYIVVTQTFSFADNKKSNHIPAYWIGITTKDTPFLLYEGVPHSLVLDDSFDSQGYWYTHPDTDNPFSLSINVFYGKVDVYIDYKELSENDLTNASEKQLNTDTAYFTIKPKKLKENCNLPKNCGIYIVVKKSSSYDAHYLVVAKSHVDRPVMLTSGVVRTDFMLAGEVSKFYMMVEKAQATVISVSFLSGFGDVYVNVPDTYVSSKKGDYPTPQKYDYKSSDAYMGKIINLNEEVFKNCDPCQIFVSVYGSSLGFSETRIEFSISYFDKARKINQNQPIKGRIGEGEVQYFNVYFDDSAKNVYVSLTNMDGDIDMYMEYGSKFPSSQNATWVSNTPYNEFIEFDKHDSFFVDNKISDLSGNYTIMLYGYTNSTYTLYISSHAKKILPLEQYTPASCKAKASNYCYFRYEEIDDIFYGYQDEYDFIIVTDFLFGSGNIYASLYDHTDYELMDDLPTSTRNDYNNIQTNSRNLLKFKVKKDNKKLTRDSMLLVAVECKEDCFFELNIVRRTDYDLQYLDFYRENIFFLNKKPDNPKTLLAFYNYNENKDVMFNVYTYEGSGNFKIYTNDTDEQNSEYKVNDIALFSVDYAKEPTHHGRISSKDISSKNVYFSVEPESDFGFYVKLSYDYEWTKIKTHKTNTFAVSSETKLFYGFFDYHEEYDSVLVSVSTDNPNVILYIYANYIVLDKTETKDNKAYKYDAPDNANAKYKSYSDKLMRGVFFKIPKPEDALGEGKYGRVLITIQPIPINPKPKMEDLKIDVTISPTKNNMSITVVEQDKYNFVEFQNISNDTKTYDLVKRLPEDDLLIIEISPCKGDVNYIISDKMNLNSHDTKGIDHEVESTGGRYFIKVNLKKYTGDNFYLNLSAKQAMSKNCFEILGIYTCEDSTSVMFYYYTTTQAEFKKSFINNKGLLEVSQVDSDWAEIKISKIKELDNSGKLVDVDAEYNVFLSDSILDYNKMESVCFLSKMTIDYKIPELKELNNTLYATLQDLKDDRKYFVNVLAKNSGTGELLAYRPIEVVTVAGRFPTLLILVIVVLVIIFAGLAWYFYKKFTVTKEILKYETSDIRNMSTLPRSEAELKTLSQSRGAHSYAHLTERNNESV